jgi:hypothetical protein
LPPPTVLSALFLVLPLSLIVTSSRLLLRLEVDLSTLSFANSRLNSLAIPLAKIAGSSIASRSIVVTNSPNNVLCFFALSECSALDIAEALLPGLEPGTGELAFGAGENGVEEGRRDGIVVS